MTFYFLSSLSILRYEVTRLLDYCLEKIYCTDYEFEQIY